ncbi:MAG: ISNCY family transposase [Mycoplasmataceae bacterium]|nr:ISNCY family transposase [Mycoplasmataceae bacterium]
MTKKELHINTVMDRLIREDILVKEASKMINKSKRQTIRIKNKYILEWSAWLIHKARWKPSNNKTDESKYVKPIQIIKDKYSDFWPTLSSEMLSKKHNFFIPVSTLRLHMIKAWIWKDKVLKKLPKQFTARPRKDSFWEMIQYDWSYHLWFEWREWTKYQCLLVAIDDATWKVTAKFAKNEWLIETFKFWKEYIELNWKPNSIYLDKFATYKVNYPNATDDKQLPTQFWRVCNELNTKLIFANTPQAKGRVERMNKTLQDRLVKALRLENINNIEGANLFLKDTFLPEFNKQFMVIANTNSNLHLKLRDDEILRLDQIFSEFRQRKIANDFTVKFNNNFYQLYREKDCWYRIKPWYTVDLELHLNWDIKISKLWKYIKYKTSFDRPKRVHKLMTAPIYQPSSDLILKKEISPKGDISTLTKEVTF